MILAGEFPSRDAALATLRAQPEVAGTKPFLRTVEKMRTVALPTE
jgi:hypothetical protein